MLGLQKLEPGLLYFQLETRLIAFKRKENRSNDIEMYQS